MQPFRSAFFVCAAAFLGACAASEVEPLRIPVDAVVETHVLGQPGEHYDGPTVTAQLLNKLSQPVPPIGVATVVVPSGGWRFTLDDARVSGGSLRMFATLESPGDGDVVTQALEPLTIRHDAGAQRVEVVDVLVRRVRRGASPERAPYLLAARTPIS